MTKWESEKLKSWSMPAEGFMGHVATDGPSLGRAGKEGGADGLLMPSQESDWTYQGAC